MNLFRSGPRGVPEICNACRAPKFHSSRRIFYRQYSNKHSGGSSASYTRLWVRSVGFVAVIGAGAALIQSSRGIILQELHAETPPASAEIQIEKPKRKKGASKEDNRDLISSQHAQVKRSWDSPGVYAWGSNSGRVAAPDLDEATIKSPRRIAYFDGVLLRDIKLDRNFGAAVTEKGDLVQWGTAYSQETTEPTPTLKGKSLIQVEISVDRILALSSSGKVYSLPVSQADQATGPKPSERIWWFPLVSSRSPISYRTIQPPNLSYSEKVTQIRSGFSHLLLLTSSGRLFSSASSSTDFPTSGQMGIPGLTWSTRPPGPYDQPHLISTLAGFDVVSIAAGDNHSLAADAQGRVFSFGDNTSGQLGFYPSADSPYIDAPSLLPIEKLYLGTSLSPRITSVAAGGSNSFFTIDATRIAKRSDDSVPRPQLGRISADTWACGHGVYGTLGNGRWTHVQGQPTKLKALSGLFEFDEQTNRVVPIRLRRLTVGATHASATMDNVTYVGASSSGTEHDTNWGADVLWWGGNEYFQLGTGKRSNVSNPVYIGPLDMAAGEEGVGAVARKARKEREEHRFQSTPWGRVKVNGRWVQMEQRVECGRFVSAVYSGV